MAKKVNKSRKQDIMIRILQNCFQELEIPLEVVTESKEIIMLISPILIGIVNFHISVSILKKSKMVGIMISKPEKIAEPNMYTLIELANRLNKMYSTVGYLAVDAESRYINMRFAVELIDGRLDIKHLKICFESVLCQAVNCFEFIESADIENLTSGELLLQYIEYSNGQREYETITYH